MIDRPKYLNLLLDFKDTDLIKIITGIRRCGKSTLLNLYIEKLKEIGIYDNQIISINLENPEYDFEDDYIKLYNYVKERLYKGGKTYVFIDEVQSLPNFQKAIDGLYINKDIDLYITGSNSTLLSGELATLLTGRYVEIKMLPLSFKEYLTAFDDNFNIEKFFMDYITYGSLPESVIIYKNNLSLVNDYLDSVLTSILYKDVMARTDVNNKSILDSIIKYLIANIGSTISIKRISDTLNSMNRSASTHTVENYVEGLLDAFLLYKVDAFDIKGKEIFKNTSKYYVSDLGIRSFLLGKKAGQDMGHIIENVVYLELKRRGFKVYVGKFRNQEVDFVVENKDGLMYFQVSLSVRDENVLERELKPLNAIKDSYPKYLITMDNDLSADYNGIKKVNLIDWLLEN